MENPAPAPALSELITAVTRLARYVQHRRSCAVRLEEGDYPCTCGLHDAQAEAANALRAARAAQKPQEGQGVDNE